MPQPRSKRTSGSLFNVDRHIVWCPKYRRNALVGDIETRLRDLHKERG